MSTTMPMIAPDGSTGDIPTANVQAAISAGFKQATAMYSPDGKLGYIPNDRVNDAVNAGFKPQQQQTIQQSQQAPPVQVPLSQKPIPSQPAWMLARQKMLRQVAPNLTQEGIENANKTAIMAVASGAGAAFAPELLPEGAGLLAHAGATAAGAGLGTSGGQILTGQNPLAAEQLKQAGINAALGGGTDLALGAVANAFGSKLARGMVNESSGATARDVTYGNPAKALLNENIATPFTGDLEAYKDALRAGASTTQAYQAAGGRIAAVASKVNELTPQINSILAKSTAKIATADVIDKPLLSAATEVINNPAMTQAEKDAAIGQLGALQHSLKEGLGPTISPLQANEIKQAIGNRINWAGNIAVTDEVKPAYRAVYGSLKQAVNNAVPEVAGINERLTNLLAAQSDLHKLMQAEEVGQGKGALGSAVTGIARRAEAVAGRAIPAAAQATGAARAVAPGGLVGLNSLMSGASGQW